MTFSTINVGQAPNDNLGEKLRNSMILINNNFGVVKDFLTSQVDVTYLGLTLSNYKTIVSADDDFQFIQGQLTIVDEKLDNKAPLVHTHSIANITGLQTSLDSKATLTQLNNSIGSINNEIANVNNYITDIANSLPRYTIDDSNNAPSASYMTDNYSDFSSGSMVYFKQINKLTINVDSLWVIGSFEILDPR